MSWGIYSETPYIKKARYWDIGNEYQNKLEKLNAEWDDWDTRFDVGIRSCRVVKAQPENMWRGGWWGGELSKMLKILEFLVKV